MARLSDAEIDRLVEEKTWRAKYEGYLQTPRWFAKRRAKLWESNFTCADCGYCGLTHPVDIQLHVHHKTYERLGDECMDDLVVLCWHCHDKYHRR